MYSAKKAIALENQREMQLTHSQSHSKSMSVRGFQRASYCIHAKDRSRGDWFSSLKYVEASKIASPLFQSSVSNVMQVQLSFAMNTFAYGCISSS